MGYLLYATLLGSIVASLGGGALQPFSANASLTGLVPALQKKMVVIAMILCLLFNLLVTYRMLLSALRLVS